MCLHSHLIHEWVMGFWRVRSSAANHEGISCLSDHLSWLTLRESDGATGSDRWLRAAALALLI